MNEPNSLQNPRPRPVVLVILDGWGVNPERVKRELAEQGLQAEDWGGDTVTVEVSAKTGQNLELLLEMILLVADLQYFAVDDSPPAGHRLGDELEPVADDGFEPDGASSLPGGGPVGDQVRIGDRPPDLQ